MSQLEGQVKSILIRLIADPHQLPSLSEDERSDQQFHMDYGFKLLFDVQ